jgi:toxin ParE1/3/4
MILHWHPDAKLEADHAAAFYQSKQQGLERRFLDNLEDALDRIQRNPQVFRCIAGDLRKCRVARFPYGIIFRVNPNYIEVIAIMHLRRKPGYWKAR